nr:MAG TPA: hypothetical protein [Caudoviricetes sp.]
MRESEPAGDHAPVGTPTEVEHIRHLLSLVF